MKYLKNRDIFLTGKVSVDSSLVNEVLQNDIAWGDSLLGRLINSVVRKSKIGINLKRIDSVIDSLKKEFDNLISMAKINSLDDKERTKVYSLITSSILMELEKSVDDEEKVNIIISITNQLIIRSKSENGDDFKGLLVKLEEFLEFLSKYDKDNKVKDDVSKDDAAKDDDSVKGDVAKGDAAKDDASKGDGANGDEVKRIEGVPVQKTLDMAHKSVPVKISVPVDVNKAKKMKRSASMKIASDKFTHLYKNASPEQARKAEELFKELNSCKEGDFKKLTNVINKINVLLSEMGGEQILESNLYLSYYDFINELNLPAPSDNKDNLPATTDNKDNLPATTDNKDNHPVVVDKVDTETIKIAFHRIFDDEYLNNWVITKEEVTELETTIDSNSDTKIVIDGIDPIIEIVKLFNRAYKIHTTPTIPSGRSGGKVSNITFSEYTYLGSGSGGTPDSPGAGPWRNDKLFDKWENAVLDIIKDSKYQVLFNKDCIIKIGNADARVNVTDTERGEIQGGGKVLLSFINAMLDGNTLYKNGAQASFIEKYFKVDVSKSNLGIGDDVKSNAKLVESISSFSFKKSELVDFEKGSIFVASGKTKSANRDYYFVVLDDPKKNDAKVLVKFSSSFEFLSKLAKDIEKGDISKLTKSDTYLTDDKKTETYKKYFTKLDISKIKAGQSLKIKPYSDAKDSVDGAEYEYTISNLYSLIDKSGKKFIIKKEDVDKLKKDTDKYNKSVRS